MSVFINNARCHGVPFVLVSGKRLDERTAYVRVVVESNIHKVHSASSEAEKCDVRQIVFHIQGEHIQKPAILISGILPKPGADPGFFLGGGALISCSIQHQ